MWRGALLLFVAGCSLVNRADVGRPTRHDERLACNDSYAWPALDVVGAVAIAGLASVLRDSIHAGDPELLYYAQMGSFFVGAASWIAGSREVAACRSAKGELASLRELHTREVAHEQRRAVLRIEAWRLTRTAAAAARVGACDTVPPIAKELRLLDPEFRETVFLRDVAIARCLTPPGTP